MRNVTFAATQFACSLGSAANVGEGESAGARGSRAGRQCRAAAGAVRDALFLPGPARANISRSPQPFEGNPLIAEMAALAGELGVVLPVSFFERAGTRYFNSLAMVDADGRVLGLYRKSHIPDGPGYQEKFYFTPGRYRLQGLADAASALSGLRHLLGPVVSGSARAPWRCMGAGVAALPDRHRQRAAAGAAGRQPRSLAPRHAGPCGRQSHAAGRLQPHRRRDRARRAK